MRINHSPIVIEYCKKKGLTIIEFQEKFDEDLKLIEAATGKCKEEEIQKSLRSECK